MVQHKAFKYCSWMIIRTAHIGGCKAHRQTIYGPKYNGGRGQSEMYGAGNVVIISSIKLVLIESDTLSP